jgi:hypothetical protein|tara:strand:+ start:588 stop:824 length:237 start_codon:yes stop_codon:yes gene_type:complete
MFGKRNEGTKRTALEYKVKFVLKPDHWQEPNSNFNTKLNDLGADGWELVTANEHIDGRGISVATTFYFKREIEEAAPK